MGYRIGVLGDLTGETTKTLRYWTDLGLLVADRSAAGYRIYGAQAVERATFIRTAQTAGFRLRDIGDLLAFAEREGRPCRDVRALAAERLAAVRAQLARLRAYEASLTDLAAAPDAACPDERCAFLPRQRS